MTLIIDRFEGEYCICEYERGKTLDLPKKLIPAEAQEGDVLAIIINNNKTQERKAYADSLKKKLFSKNP